MVAKIRELVQSFPNDESVEELADTDQAYEAGIVKGVEDADDHPENPVHTHEDQGKTEDIPPKPA